MAIKAKVFGAGSIGNHLTNAARSRGWDVTVIDTDREALMRMKEDIYPKRYGEWDESIQLYTPDNMPVGGFDAVLIGTPPDVHLPVALQVLKSEAPKVLQIEKPLCTPTLENLKEFLKEAKLHPETKIVVGYNHLLSGQTDKATEILLGDTFKNPVSLDCEFRSHWGGILGAHPWLSGPEDTYLGYWRRGGGAGGEHSHGINTLQYFAQTTGVGRIRDVNATIDIVKEGKAEYDRAFFIDVTFENGAIGRLAQDVVTHPKKKFVSISFENGALDWRNDVSKTTDEVIVNVRGSDAEVIEIEKTRPEEFEREIDHIESLIKKEIDFKDSPINLERGVETMLVLNAAFVSHKKGKRVSVDYSILD